MSEFKTGDLVRCKPGFNTSESSGGLGYEEGFEFTVTSASGSIAWGGKYDNGVFFRALELVNKESSQVEEVKLAEYVRVERNTELFKKGSVFKKKEYHNYYEAKDSSVYLDDGMRSITPRIGVDTVNRLPKVFVPVIKFNPEFVTEEENKRLQDALTQKPAKKTTKSSRKTK